MSLFLIITAILFSVEEILLEVIFLNTMQLLHQFSLHSSYFILTLLCTLRPFYHSKKILYLSIGNAQYYCQRRNIEQLLTSNLKYFMIFFYIICLRKLRHWTMFRCNTGSHNLNSQCTCWIALSLSFSFIIFKIRDTDKAWDSWNCSFNFYRKFLFFYHIFLGKRSSFLSRGPGWGWSE